MAVETAAAMLMEARGLLLKGWSQGPRLETTGAGIPAWSRGRRRGPCSARSSPAGTATTSRSRLISSRTRSDARALGDAMAALGTATGSADLDGWNDAEERHLSDVLAVIDTAIRTLPD